MAWRHSPVLEVEATSVHNGRLSRRTALKAGFLGLGSLSFAELLRLQSQAALTPVASDSAVILLFCGGGPSQLETYDLKPQAPSEIRGPLRPIRTNVPGIEVCELLPEHAKVADKFSLIRSVHHGEADHPAGTFRFMSGFRDSRPGGAFGQGQSAFPCLTAVVNRALGICRDGNPVAVDVSDGGHWYGSPGDWGEMYRVPCITRGFENWRLNMPAEKLADRIALLGQFDRIRRSLDLEGNMQATSAFHQQAAEILISGRTHEAFDLTHEDPKLRQRYGAGWGEYCLIARRLVERGVNLATVYVPGKPPGSVGNNYDWDDHAVNWDLIGAMQDRLPFYDRAVATLIEDLHQRGLDKKVLLLVTGEFGRTPKIDTTKPGRIGRDHWPSSMSMLIAGGKGPRGAVIGATNKNAEFPVDRPLDPDDIRATLLHHLGIDYTKEIVSRTGRPMPLCYGRHLPEWS